MILSWFKDGALVKGVPRVGGGDPGKIGEKTNEL